MTIITLICAAVTLCALLSVVSCLTACRKLVDEMRGMRESTDRMADRQQSVADRLLSLEAATKRTGAEVNALHQAAAEKTGKRKKVTP